MLWPALHIPPLAALLCLLLASTALAQQPYNGEVLTTELQTAAGQPVFVEMAVTPQPGSEHYISTLASVEEKPAGAGTEILPGFPRLRFSADTPGRYRLVVRITLVSKSSCGGVESLQLAEEPVTVLVTQ